ncbi:MAG: hypothetical protein KKC11_06180 [Candidatus Omnitrophica bacterium]|nr:hypothetical protein [Candidatus Omnitrophota bacterium]
MNKSPTKVIFLWHMHQPSYKHPHKDYYILPWVRLHAVKDYYGMAKLLEKFDKVKIAFNFSGILLEQLVDYAANSAKDYYSILSLKNPAYLKRQEKDFIIERFFSVNFERFIKPNRRYLALYNKKLSPKLKFSSSDIGDLQVLFNMSWFHPYTFDEDKNLRRLKLKQENYTQSDKQYVINKQYEVIRQIIPLYASLLREKRIELTLTPYHHPIMPLIYDTDILENFPYLKKPLSRFTAPLDCAWHLEASKDIFKETFGTVPCGSWPSEGGVSEDVISLYADEGFKWIGADEAILFKSLTTEYVSYDTIKNQRHLIYRPYRFKGVDIFFRDRNFSDMLSFIYQGWDDSAFAASDLLEHFKRTHCHIRDIFKQRAITIIMDGENAWEYYKNNGVDFLEAVYSALEKSQIFSTVTPAEFLKHTPSKNLERIKPGSWINGDFGVWIGSKQNNFYWHILRKMKDLIEKNKGDSKISAEIKDYFHLLQGSDWYWWNTFTDTSKEFKRIFFTYVEKIYQLLGKKVPAYLKSKEQRAESKV